MKRALSTFAAIAAIGCGQNDNSETPQDIGSGATLPDTGNFDMAQDMMADTRADLDAALDAGTQDSNLDSGNDTSDPSDAEADTGPVFIGTNLSIEATDYESAQTAAEQVMIDQDSEYYMPVYGLGAYPEETTETQERIEHKFNVAGQPQLQETTDITGPEGEIIPTGQIVDGLFCILPDFELESIREPDFPFNSCEPTAVNCDLRFTTNVSDSNRGSLVVKFEFNCPNADIPLIDNTSGENGDNLTHIISLPAKKQYTIEPNGCSLSDFRIEAQDCTHYVIDLYDDEYPKYFSETFTPSRTINP